MTNCPPEAMLRLIGTDLISEATFADLESHVEQCAECQRILEAEMQSGTPKVAQPAPPVLPGLVLEHELGRGGASRVYLAWEPTLGRHVAVKLFSKNSLVDPHAREHWLAEARALSRVPHDQVVAIHKVDENDEWLWLVLEYVAGGTLKERLTEPLPSRVAARLAETIARTVAYFHGRGVVHLDLKPSNILIGGQRGEPWELVSPKISDFGIARLEGEPGVTETGVNGPKGTPSYMAPEQVAAVSGTIGPAADVYAMGALLYHLLTGRPPFQGASSADTFDQVRHQEVVAPRRLNGRIPRDLETICLKCLEKLPKSRYSSAEALANDLRLWLDGRPIKARRVSPIGHAWRACRRHPVAAGLLVALALTLTTGVAGLLVLLHANQLERERLAEERKQSRIYGNFTAKAARQFALLIATSVHHRPPAAETTAAGFVELSVAAGAMIESGRLEPEIILELQREIGWALVTSGKKAEALELSDRAVLELKRKFSQQPDNTQIRDYLRWVVAQDAVFASCQERLQRALDRYADGIALVPLTHLTGEQTQFLLAVDWYVTRLVHSAPSKERPHLRAYSQQIRQNIYQRLLGPRIAQSADEQPVELRVLDQLLRDEQFKAVYFSVAPANQVGYKELLTHWIADSEFVDYLLSVGTSTRHEPAQAEKLTKSMLPLLERLSRLEIPPKSIFADIFDRFSDERFFAASIYRRTGDHQSAREIEKELMELGNALVREYPNEAFSHRVLSIAFDQAKKNAFSTNDDRLIHESAVKSLAAAERSVTLDPDQPRLRAHIDSLAALLASIKADREAAAKAAQSSAASKRPST